jgi:hypothetical protein
MKQRSTPGRQLRVRLTEDEWHELMRSLIEDVDVHGDLDPAPSRAAEAPQSALLDRQWISKKLFGH